MDKFEYQAKLEEIGKLIDGEDYAEAVQIADTIDWRRVRSVRTLCSVSEIYEAVGRVEDSKAILSRAYRRSPNSRQILYRLSEVCVLTQDFDDAVEYYTEYVNLSPNDSSKYILKYKIYKGRGSSVEEQIKVLEDLKTVEYTERWAYELASLYDQAGMAQACVAECDDLALWFHTGKYVVQALKLKQKYVALTPEQQTICDNPSEIVDMETKEEVIEKAVPTLNEEIEKDLPTSKTDVIADSILMSTEKEIAAAVAEQKAVQERQLMEEPAVEPEEEEETTEEEPADVPEEDEEEKPVIFEKKGKAFDPGSLQIELANSMRHILSGFKSRKKPVEIIEETQEEAEESAEAQPEDDLASLAEAADEIAQTVEVDDLPIPEESEEEPMEEAAEEPAEEPEEAVETEEVEEAEPSGEDDGLDDILKTLPDAEEDAAQAPVVTADDVLTAATINLGESIRKEIGEASLREYAAAKAARKAAEEKMTRKVILDEVPLIDDPVLEIPEVPEIKIPTLDMPQMPELKPVKEPEPPKEMPEVEELPEIEEEEVEEEPAEDETELAEAQLKETEELLEEIREAEEGKIDPMNYTREGLDEKEKNMLGFWGRVTGIPEQVDLAVTQIMRSALKDKTSSSGNVILVGDAGNGRTTLAISVAKIVGRCKGLVNAKVAKIYAEDLNNKDIAQVVSKVAGGVLIIEEAGDLSDNAIAQLSMAMDFKTDSLVVFLEDERRYLQELLARNPKFAQKFDITITVPLLTDDQLVEFGQYYALQKDSVLGENAVVSLYDRISTMQSPEQPLAILDIKELMDKAIKRANTFSLGKLFSTLSGKRYDADSRVIIGPGVFKKIK